MSCIQQNERRKKKQTSPPQALTTFLLTGRYCLSDSLRLCSDCPSKSVSWHFQIVPRLLSWEKDPPLWLFLRFLPSFSLVKSILFFSTWQVFLHSKKIEVLRTEDVVHCTVCKAYCTDVCQSNWIPKCLLCHVTKKSNSVGRRTEIHLLLRDWIMHLDSEMMDLHFSCFCVLALKKHLKVIFFKSVFLSIFNEVWLFLWA